MSDRLSWAVLLLLCFALLVGALTFDRGAWPRLLGDEATYLMQAQSIAWDQDLQYERQDYERFVDQWGFAPEGLILQSGNKGQTITYGKPVIYSLAIAPFVRLAPRRGAMIGNAVFLILASLLAAATLTRTLGSTAPLWVSAFVFASVTFAHVFWAHADLFLMCLVAVSLSLIYRGSWPEDRTWVPQLMAAGMLLALVALSRPLYLSLLLPAALATWSRRSKRPLGSLAAGVAIVLLLSVLGNLSLRQTWTPYGGERMGFYSHTGFPDVQFSAAAWADKIGDRPGTGSWVEKGKLRFPINPRLAAYDLYYFWLGRNIGLIPYFLPCLLGLIAFRKTRGRWSLLIAIAATAAGFFYLRAFNFYGGGGSIGNRYFLPMYPAFWFLVGRPRDWRWPVLAASLATPFLLPLWTAPRAFPIHSGGGFRYVASAAKQWLPHETSLSHLKPAGREDVIHNGLWVKFLSLGSSARPDTPWLRGGNEGPTELLIGHDQPLRELVLTLESQPFSAPSVGGAVGTMTPLDETATRYRLDLEGTTARHRMWWTFDDVYLYRIKLHEMGTNPESSSKFSFQLEPGTQP